MLVRGQAWEEGTPASLLQGQALRKQTRDSPIQLSLAGLFLFLWPFGSGLPSPALLPSPSPFSQGPS